VDLGAGDGRFVLAHAAAHPERLVVGIDAHAAALAGAARRAVAPHSHRGLPNALFVVSAVEALPEPLADLADLVTVHFPWGSLRDAITGGSGPGAARMAALVRPGGRLEVLVANAPRDGTAVLDPEAVAAAWEARGFRLAELRPAGLADAVAAHSSWGKRLLRNPAPGRLAWRLELEHPPTPSRGAD